MLGVEAMALYHHLPNAQWALIPGAGHVPQLELPDARRVGDPAAAVAELENILAGVVDSLAGLASGIPRLMTDEQAASFLRHLERERHASPATVRAYALAAQVNPEAGKPMGEAEKKLLFGIEPKG